jgi:sialate O-acetylesterase
MKSRLLLTFFWAALSQNIFCQVKLPQLISDGMVLQRDAKVNVWGWASPGEKVMIHFINKEYSTEANAEGKWKILLSPMAAGGPYKMDIRASNHLTLNNILMGDVWVCSGQSNMALPMGRVKEKYPAEIVSSTNTSIRQFFIPTTYNFDKPDEDLPASSWQSADPKTVLKFSAAAYFFARNLCEKYHVPIGLINTSVGGSPVEAWMSEDALKSFPKYLKLAEQARDTGYVNKIKRNENAASYEWYHNLWLKDKGMQGEIKWYDTSYNADSWPTMNVPVFWSDNGLKTNGVVWFRKEFNVPTSMIGKPQTIFLGRIVDADSVYINGEFIGTTGYQYPPRIYDLPPDLLKPGKNIIVVRIINSAGNGGFIKDKPYEIISGKSTIDLKGKWQYQLGASTGSLAATTFFQYKPSGLYNSMVAPLLNYAIKGVIWYQGETNSNYPSDYNQLFSAMINDWRTKWNQGNFPFLFVQLPNYGTPGSEPAESNWAKLREQQLKTLSVPNTAMAVTIDIGEWNDIHPLDKKDVGNRLSLAAQHLAYGNKEVVYSGPIYKSMQVIGNKIVLTFSNTGSGLIAKGGGELKYFSIAGSDKKFVWAKAKISGNKIFVWSPQIKHPAAVRYAWADNPEGANLYNKEGLPASPFRTD